MNYKSRYAQPFTLSEAILLDVSIITEEIARLQDSLQRLRETQNILREQGPDPEFAKAIEENETVIGSQEERIGILRLALVQKGASSSYHYDTTPVATPLVEMIPEPDPENDNDEGIHL